MNSTYFEMNPYYYDMASNMMQNTTTFLNATAYEFFTNQWPAFSSKMDLFWARMKEDPQAWIALYPLTLFFLAIFIWSNKTEQMPRYYTEEVEELLKDNIITRNRRVVVVTPKKRKDDHPMIRRSQATRMYISFE
jgi:hypothetical protein